jgi:hypothetical protein
MFGVCPFLNALIWYLYGRYTMVLEYKIRCENEFLEYYRDIHNDPTRSAIADLLNINPDSPLYTCPPTLGDIDSYTNELIDKLRSELNTNSPASCQGPSMVTEHFSVTGEHTPFVMKFKADNLANMKYPPYPTAVINPHSQLPASVNSSEQVALRRTRKVGCKSYVSVHVSQKQDCVAVAFMGVPSSLYSLRFNQKWKLERRLNTDNMEPAGYFKKVPFAARLCWFSFMTLFSQSKVGHEKGRERLIEKMGPFISNLLRVEDHFREILATAGKRPGDDIVLMVMNEGEMDLLLNLVCSMHASNISVANMMVVAASPVILPMIHATG